MQTNSTQYSSEIGLEEYFYWFDKLPPLIREYLRVHCPVPWNPYNLYSDFIRGLAAGMTHKIAEETLLGRLIAATAQKTEEMYGPDHPESYTSLAGTGAF